MRQQIDRIFVVEASTKSIWRKASKTFAEGNGPISWEDMWNCFVLVKRLMIAKNSF